MEKQADLTRQRVVIVGAGFGGMNVAKGLANDPRFEETIIDRRNHHLFQPLLYQVATCGLSPADIARPIRQIFSKARLQIYNDPEPKEPNESLDL